MRVKTKTFIGIFVLLALIVGGVVFYIASRSPYKTGLSSHQETKAYNPEIHPADFSTKITNRYFALPIGKKLTYEAKLASGIDEKIEIEVLKDTKIIEGIETVIYLDKVYDNGQLVEETRDYLAQHKNGDVWYFGEDVNNFENGKLKDHAGTFMHGRDGAKAGIWMKAEQKIGDSYRQEYYPGEAEDMRDTIATGLTISTKLGTYTDCVKVYDWTPLDKASREYKYYCPQVGSLVLNEDLTTGDRSELIEVIAP
jgi:hypothetical protein